MKAVILSAQPKEVEKIANDQQTILVYKTKPKLETPFKCYIYCTKKKGLSNVYSKGWSTAILGKGKVIGEFICDKIEMVNAQCSDYGIDLFYHDCISEGGFLTENAVNKYFNIPEGKDLRVMKGNGYTWHISDLKIYYMPKKLSEFMHYCDGNCKTPKKVCRKVKDYAENNKEALDIWVNCDCLLSLTCPPQSWYYVEE